MRERWMFVVPALICLFSAGANPEVAGADDSAPRVNRCVKYGQTLGADKQSLDIRLVNDCDAVVSCQITWKVKCEGQAAQTREERTFDLTVGEQRTTNAS